MALLLHRTHSTKRYINFSAIVLTTLYLSSPASAEWTEFIIDSKMSGDDKALADIDGDGYVDIIAGGKLSAGEPLTWYRFPDWQKFVIAHPSVEFTTEMDTADMDGDGDSDLVVCDGPSGINCRYYVNPRPEGDPTHQSAWSSHAIGSGGNWVHDLQTGDYNSDNRMDVITNRGLFTQQTDGTFSKQSIPGSTFADIDNDGDLDIVSAAVWYENPDWISHPGPGEGDKIRVADIDGNGINDIVVNSGDTTADLAWYSSTSAKSGNWQKHILQADVSGGHTLAIGDIDGDNDLDILSARMFNEIAAFFNNGKGAFSKQIVSYAGIHNGVLGDVDNDGDLDILGCNHTGNPPLRLWRFDSSTEPPTADAPAISPMLLLLGH